MEPNNNRRLSVVWYLEGLTGSRKTLYWGETRIGRCGFPNVDIGFNESFVSRLHCVIFINNGCVQIMDKVTSFFQVFFI